MRYLVISDIHDKIDTARRIIDHEPHDRRIFLGDFFDDFPTGAKAAKQTAIFAREQLRDDFADVVMGNHDMSYGWGHANRELMSAGFTKAKHDAIHAELSWDDWCKFKLHLWVPGPRRRPWLITHAGFDYHFLPDGQGVVDVVDHRCAMALKSLHGPIPYERGRGHSILGCGRDRCGSQYKGGVLWCDWRSLDMPPGMDQLVGHTPGREPRVEDQSDAIGVCLDTGLRHYGILEDGLLSVKETHRIPIAA